MQKKIHKLMTTFISLVAVLSLTTSVAFARTFDELKSEFYTMVVNRGLPINVTREEGDLVVNYENTDGSPKFASEALGTDTYTLHSLTSFGYISRGGEFVELTVGYRTTVAQEDFINQKSKEIVAKIIKPGATDLQKTQLLYDYVCNNISKGVLNRNDSAYNALSEGKTSYVGFALTLYKLYDAAGIPCMIVESNNTYPESYWNLAQVNGKWYHFDTSSAVSGVRAAYYGVSDTKMVGYGLKFDRGILPIASENLVYATTASTTPIALATAAVVQCEKVRTVESVNASAKIVNTLPVGAQRTALLARLQKVQVAIRSAVTAPTNPALDTATASVVQCEKIRTMESVNASAKIVNTLPSGAARTALLARVQKVQVAIRAASR